MKHKLTPTNVIAITISRAIGAWITEMGQEILRFQINMDRDAEIARVVKDSYKEALGKIDEWRDRLFDENGQPLVNEASKAAQRFRESFPHSCCQVTL